MFFLGVASFIQHVVMCSYAISSLLINHSDWILIRPNSQFSFFLLTIALKLCTFYTCKLHSFLPLMKPLRVTVKTCTYQPSHSNEHPHTKRTVRNLKLKNLLYVLYATKKVDCFLFKYMYINVMFMLPLQRLYGIDTCSHAPKKYNIASLQVSFDAYIKTSSQQAKP